MFEIGSIAERANQPPVGQQPRIFRDEKLIEVGRAGGLGYLLRRKMGRVAKKGDDDRESEAANPELLVVAHSELCLTGWGALPGGWFADTRRLSPDEIRSLPGTDSPRN